MSLGRLWCSGTMWILSLALMSLWSIQHSAPRIALVVRVSLLSHWQLIMWSVRWHCFECGYIPAWCLTLMSLPEDGVGNQQVKLSAFAQQQKAIAIHLPNSTLPYKSSPPFLVPTDSGVQVAWYYKLVGGRRVTQFRVQVSIELLSGLLCACHCRGVHAHDGEEAFDADREAKLHNPFIYVGEKTGNLFQETGLDGESSVYSVLMWSLAFREESVAPCLLLSVTLPQPVEFHWLLLCQYCISTVPWQWGLFFSEGWRRCLDPWEYVLMFHD